MTATDETYDTLVAGDALVAFYAEWDAGFRRNRPAVEAAAKARGLRLVLVNIDQCPQMRLKVIGVPEFWLFKDGVRIARRIGTFAYGEGDVTSAEVERWLDSATASVG